MGFVMAYTHILDEDKKKGILIIGPEDSNVVGLTVKVRRIELNKIEIISGGFGPYCSEIDSKEYNKKLKQLIKERIINIKGKNYD